jgi:iron complex transport system substrate-binding protein
MKRLYMRGKKIVSFGERMNNGRSVFRSGKLRALVRGASFLAVSLVIFSCQPCFSQSLRPRYISLAPSTTEILFALGLDAEIVGVSSYCNYPPQTRGKEKVGTFSQPNIEKILNFKPDYIFCTGLEQAPIVDELRRLNLKVYTAHPSNMQELLSSIIDIGKITGRQKEAEALVESMRSQIEKINSQVASIPPEARPKVFIEIWNDPLTTVGRGSFLDDLLTLAGGINIAADAKRAFSIFSPEEVIRRNPDCIILAYMNKQDPVKMLSSRFGWKEISAVKNNRVYSDIDPDLLLRPGPRVVIGLKQIHQRLYRYNE